MDLKIERATYQDMVAVLEAGVQGAGCEGHHNRSTELPYIGAHNDNAAPWIFSRSPWKQGSRVCSTYTK